MKKISIIIVTFNSSNIIKKCLDSIINNNDIGEKLEIIIVDNNSDDVECVSSIIKEYYQGKIVFVKNNKNGGYGYGNNIGIKISSAPIILIMNPDVILNKPIFQELYSSFTNHNVVIVGLQQYENEHRKGRSFLMLNTSIFELIFYKIYKLLNIYNQKHCCFSGACFAIRKEIIENIGYFNENIFLYGEEKYIHLSIACKIKKCKFLYNKNISYIHPIENRVNSDKQVIMGLQSSEYIHKVFGLNYKRSYRQMINMYKFMKIISLVRNNFKKLKLIENTLNILYTHFPD
ncbi:glycosyltransferase [Treponema primitia]|uniref:glycosyltransferase n=1 Tax=Treponema primitia TaxID=88058 RepID=UPI0002554EC6|nr:glycosyltransferase [Treponema primitia]